MQGANRLWMSLIGVNVIVIGFVAYSAMAPGALTKTMLMPGKTSHGHYQIEMRCDVCHTEGSGIREDACLDCHAEELRRANDTHPSSKFNDPTNAELLSILDAQNCLSCHREHVDEQTLPMGLTMPSDYCYHCHQETLTTRPSHANFAFDSCATAGCHNYHDNRALYENFLNKHADEPDFLDEMVRLTRSTPTPPESKRLTKSNADAPEDWPTDETILDDWASTAHAAAGVNCGDCHSIKDKDAPKSDKNNEPRWSQSVALATCGECHQNEAETFLQGHHGMRLAQDLPAMTPGESRIAMHTDAAHRTLDCNACHSGHRFDTEYASVEACLSCHNDEHSQSFLGTSHHDAWIKELAGEAPRGSGVTCATCHMPRIEDEGGDRFVQHNQNDNLRPNEKMIREVCMNCHGLAFSIDALADSQLVKECFATAPSIHIESVDLARARFEEKQRKKEARLKKK
ncbi:ammonia-forming cytochrome c nitrite reductase subunit c552 [Aporhodopirellula aestuarii]|uniref:nitrite reductase (cytochrome; ammonia-forming) n=1 Tax=Aporhodopirellula aestuarii TaxID=2950107 RepID=A0ABT0TY96_9BACT|nr:ammonia-forming cytochrome c nitrite reductase subunit c552 [Aporhodopirellula aestuarii]MCM2369568.1 ammonia-forming cytochrome c nitrite reductase subunit c552 [Aporhodopirellula aestuarii]